MIKATFEFTPEIKLKMDIKPVADAMHDAGQALGAALSSALSGTMFPGMTESVDVPGLSFMPVQVDDRGELEFDVRAPSEIDKIEEGTKPWDMKPFLVNGPKHRVAKNGDRYNIIPFVHDRNKLPTQIKALAGGLSPSYILGQYLEVRSDDQWEVTRNAYLWGENTGTLPKVDGKTNRYSNMYNFGNRMVTFRTVSDKTIRTRPNSWIHPGKPPNPVTESVWAFMQPVMTSRISGAWAEVIEKWLS